MKILDKLRSLFSAKEEPAPEPVQAVRLSEEFAEKLKRPTPEPLRIPDEVVLKDRVQEAATLFRLKHLDEKKRRAYRLGQKAKEIGMMRISPFYEDEGSDAAWFAGYDGKDLPTLDAILAPYLENESAQA